MRDEIDYQEFCRRGQLWQKSGGARAGMPDFNSVIRAGVPRQDLGAGRPFHGTVRGTHTHTPTRIVQAITFDSVDPAFSGEMNMVVTFEDRDGGTEVTILFEHIPSSIRPEDNDAGTRSSLEKLARYIE